MTTPGTPTSSISGDATDRNASPAVGSTTSPGSDADLLFKYYLQQWEQVRHCENMRSAFSLQLLATAAGSVVGYFYFKQCGVLQIALGSVVVAIGVLGFFVVRALEQAADIHIRRARKARACLPRIDAIASEKAGFYPLAGYFRALNLLIVVFGLALVSIAIRALSTAAPMQCVIQ
jgi:hypothetical protein